MIGKVQGKGVVYPDSSRRAIACVIEVYGIDKSITRRSRASVHNLGNRYVRPREVSRCGCVALLKTVVQLVGVIQ